MTNASHSKQGIFSSYFQFYVFLYNVRIKLEVELGRVLAIK